MIYNQAALLNGFKKLKHWHGIAISACEQCGRGVLPGIIFHESLEQALAGVDASRRLLLDFDGAPLSAEAGNAGSSVAILLGPEGGLNTHEIDLARNSGFVPVTLGNRVLRFETAATAALAIVQSEPA